MKRNEKAVAIAKDVLKQLRKKAVKLAVGIYLRGRMSCDSSETGASIKETNAQEKVEQLTKSCEACALGACLLSHIRLFDKVLMEELGHGSGDGWNHWFNAEVTHGTNIDILSNAFSREDLHLMEAAFEGVPIDPDSKFTKWDYVEERLMVGRNNFGLNQEKMDIAIAFGKRFKTMRGRLQAIMKNVIRNDGHFIPAALVTA